jgi:chromosome segregation ATPase
MGKGYWSFDRRRKEAYDMKMQELEQLNTKLINQINSLSERLKPEKTPIELPITDQPSHQLHSLEEKISQLESQRDQVEAINGQLRTEIIGLKSDLNDEIKRKELIIENNLQEITLLQEKLDAGLSALEITQRELTRYKEDLNRISQAFRTPLGRFLSRIFKLSSNKNRENS